MSMTAIISPGIVLLVSVLLAVSGLKKMPGIGIFSALALGTALLLVRGENLTALGFRTPESWVSTVLLGLLLGIGIQLLGEVLIEPLSERLTGTHHDYSLLENIRGNWKALLQWLVMVWLLVAFLEEAIFRGFLMTELGRAIGYSTGALVLNVVLTSTVFGLAHGYQGRAGILSTGVVGAVLAVIFILSDFNLWLAIFTHGFIDTIGLVMLALGANQTVRKRIWKI